MTAKLTRLTKEDLPSEFFASLVSFAAFVKVSVHKSGEHR
jgi:hypothetical protein